MFKIIGADQQQYGPVSAEQIRQWIAEGRANAQTLVLAEGSTEWKPLGTIPELAEAVRATAPPPPPPPPSPGLPGGAAPGPIETRPHVPNYLVQSILVTLCCCIPFGLIAVVYAAQVSNKLNAGDIAGATAASRNARLWCWLGFGAGLLVGIAYLIYAVIHGLNVFRHFQS